MPDSARSGKAKPSAIGPEAPDELGGLKASFPTRWIQRVPEGHPFVAVFRGTHMIFARTQEEMRAKLNLR